MKQHNFEAEGKLNFSAKIVFEFFVQKTHNHIFYESTTNILSAQ